MKNNRLERINSEIRKAVAEIIDRDLRDPQITAIISVVSVETTPDLSFCRIYINSIGNTPEDEVLARIKGAAGFIRGRLSKMIKLRITPRLDFVRDTAEDYALKIDNILKNITYSTQPEEDDEE